MRNRNAKLDGAAGRSLSCQFTHSLNGDQVEGNASCGAEGELFLSDGAGDGAEPAGDVVGEVEVGDVCAVSGRLAVLESLGHDVV